MVSFGGVVVHDVEDHLESRGVEGAHHVLKLPNLLTPGFRESVLVVRREVREGIVAPVVAKVELVQSVVLNKLVHGHQFDARHTEVEQVFDAGRVREAGVGAAQLLGDTLVERAEALDVQLVDDGLVRRYAGPLHVAPVVARVDDDRFADVRIVALRVLNVDAAADFVAVHGGAPINLALDGLRVRIDEDFVGVIEIACRRVPVAVHAVAVERPREYARNEDVPDVVRLLGHAEADNLPARVVRVKQAQVYPIGVLAVDGEVGALLHEGSTERVRLSGPGVGSAPGVDERVCVGGSLLRHVGCLRRQAREVTGDQRPCTWAAGFNNFLALAD